MVKHFIIGFKLSIYCSRADCSPAFAKPQNEIAKNYVEMGAALRSGKMAEEINKAGYPEFCKTKIEEFANVFAAVYNS